MIKNTSWSRAYALLFFVLSLAIPLSATAAGIEAGTSTPIPGGGEKWSLSMETLLLMTSMTLLPTIGLMMTGFTRIIIVLSLLRSAMGTASTPPNQVILGVALFLTLFVMSPVLNKVYQGAWQPYSEGKINIEEFVVKGSDPFREFMLRQTREADIARLAEISGQGDFNGPEDVPFNVLLPAFVLSEVKTGFQIGFTIFIPFLIIDLVVASVLMALGMMMVPPATVSLPFKIMLFVLADGWNILIGSLANSFFIN